MSEKRPEADIELSCVNVAEEPVRVLSVLILIQRIIWVLSVRSKVIIYVEKLVLVILRNGF